MTTAIRSNPESTTSTTCSTPPIHDIYSVFVSEKYRYRQKGYGLISASVITLAFYFYAPVLA